jgi:hypothetical protein
LKALTALGALMIMFGLPLMFGYISFAQFSYCIGAKVFGVCLGAPYNYTWIVGVAVLFFGFLLVVFSR